MHDQHAVLYANLAKLLRQSSVDNFYVTIRFSKSKRNKRDRTKEADKGTEADEAGDERRRREREKREGRRERSEEDEREKRERSETREQNGIDGHTPSTAVVDTASDNDFSTSPNLELNAGPKTRARVNNKKMQLSLLSSLTQFGGGSCHLNRLRHTLAGISRYLVSFFQALDPFI